jgi:hypothetical protein
MYSTGLHFQQQYLLIQGMRRHNVHAARAALR